MEIVLICPPSTYLYTCRLLYCSTLIIETSFYRRWWLTQRPTTGNVKRIRDFGVLSSKQVIYIVSSSSKALGSLQKRLERFQKPDVVDLFSKTAFSKYVMVMAHELSTVVTAFTRLEEVQAIQNPAWMGEIFVKSLEVPPLAKELLEWEGESIFFMHAGSMRLPIFLLMFLHLWQTGSRFLKIAHEVESRNWEIGRKLERREWGKFDQNTLSACMTFWNNKKKHWKELANSWAWWYKPNPSTPEAEAGRSLWVWGQPCLHSEFQDNQS